MIFHTIFIFKDLTEQILYPKCNRMHQVANHFNNFFSTVAENIGKDTVYDPSDHPSLIEIKKQHDCTKICF